MTTPIDIVADIATCGGLLTDKDEPYTVSRVKGIMQNLDNAVDPDEYTDEQIRRIVDELNRRQGR